MADQPTQRWSADSGYSSSLRFAGAALAIGTGFMAFRGGLLAVAACGLVAAYAVLIYRSHAHRQAAEITEAVRTVSTAKTRLAPDLGAPASGGLFGPVYQELAALGVTLDDREEQVRDAIQRERLKTLELEVFAERFEETSHQLQDANEELEAFAYSASHDMAAPLRVIEGLTKIVIEDYGHLLDAVGRTHLETVHGSSERLLALLHDLLVLSRLRPPSKDDIKDVAIGDIVDNVVRDVQSEVPENGRIMVSGTLPTVQTPPERLRQVLQNLVTNGFKYNDSDQPVVSINGWTEGGIAVIRVSDNGIGIPEHMQEEAFGLFTRLHTNRATPGTGAGLAIARRSIRSIGGELWIEGSSDQGTSFVVAIPVFFSTEAAGIRWGQVLEPH